MTEDEFYSNPIGAGAFVIDEWSLGGRIVLTPSPYFYDPERPHVDEVVIDVVADETARQILLQGGEAHVIELLSPTIAPQYGPDDIYVCAVHAIEHLGLNVPERPFDDPLLRQAVAYAIDYEAIDTALGEYFGLPSGILATNLRNWVPPTKPYFRRDLARAQDLIAQSAAAGGTEVELIVDAGNTSTCW